MTNRQAVFDLLRSHALELQQRYAIRTLALFGSMARGDDHEQSDIDILVTFEEGQTNFRNFMGLKDDLESMLGRHIDLGPPNMLRPELKAAIEQEAIRVA